VTEVRREAARLAERHGREWIVVDGPPGIGCPVIASLTGADLALVVTEPTPSGESDLFRVLELARHFRMKAAVVINKADLHPARSEDLSARVEETGVPVIGRFPYDEEVTIALRERCLLSEHSAAWRARLQSLWASVEHLLVGADDPIARHEPIQLTMYPETRGGLQ
jgi:MinD superfamily P-loop ATPase